MRRQDEGVIVLASIARRDLECSCNIKGGKLAQVNTIQCKLVQNLKLKNKLEPVSASHSKLSHVNSKLDKVCIRYRKLLHCKNSKNQLPKNYGKLLLVIAS